MSISLVLSGGAARGAFELGVLQYFDEQNIHIKNISFFKSNDDIFIFDCYFNFIPISVLRIHIFKPLF